MKYIIEIENEPFGRNDDPFFYHGMDELYRAKGFKSLVFDQYGLDKLTPYTEPDRKAIEDEVWEFCMNTDWSWISEIDTKPLREYSYQEAKVKYEAWRKQKDEIRVGDEVTLYNNVKLVVVTIDHGTSVQGIDENGECYEYIELDKLTKTGRHYDEVEDMLKKMKGA